MLHCDRSDLWHPSSTDSPHAGQRAVRRTEALHHELEERLTTFFERQQDGREPFVELLAADTLKRAEQISPASLAPQRGLVCVGRIMSGDALER